MNAREQTLKRARAGQAWAPKAQPGPDLPVAVADEPSLLGARFADAARAVDAEVEVHQELGSARQSLKALVRGRSILAWDEPDLPPAAAWALDGETLRRQASPRAQRLAAEVGLTACDWAIADTGTLVLVAGPGKPREASLSVRTHVALLDPRRLLPDLAAALRCIERLGNRAAHVNLVTGPSRTADIEMTLTKGVHGPGRLIILMAPWEGV